MEKYYGNYLGLVVSDDGQDPERRGRIQVWVPGITNTMYGGWNDDPTDKKIYYIGDDSQLKDVDIQRLRAVLPWAECASPLIGGGGTPLYYNKSSGGTVQTSDPSSSPQIELNNTETLSAVSVADAANTDVVQYEGYEFTDEYNDENQPLYRDIKTGNSVLSEDIPPNTKYTVPQY